MQIADAPSPASIARVISTSTTGRTPISAEARGLVRELCRRVRHEARQLNKLAISAALQRRMARYPDRRPRESMVRDLERNWRTAEGSHALARWYQRRGTRADARLLNDLAVGAAIDLSDCTSFPDLDSARIPIDATAGWHGAIMRLPEATYDELCSMQRYSSNLTVPPYSFRGAVHG